ncbi:protein-domain-containing protein [Globomyces pollinis-pini]|nr:protein-domain-containing protein [Globomyces pollinis-pini]
MIFQSQAFDDLDPLEQELIKRHSVFEGIIKIANGPLELQQQSVNHYLDVEGGLFYGILTDNAKASQYFGHLSFIVRDRFRAIIVKLIYLISTVKFQKIYFEVRKQIMWIMSQLMNNIQQVDMNPEIFIWILKQIRGGDISFENNWLASSTRDIMESHLQWLKLNPTLTKHVIYTYTRIIADHTTLSVLRPKEVSLVIQLIRENFMEMVAIGRDYLRLLQGVAQIEEFKQLLSDIFINPKDLHPDFQGIEQIVNTPTPRDFIVSRLTPDMEYKIIFILNTVPQKLHFTYLDHFRQRFMTTQDSESLAADIIRFLCTVVHPDNSVLRSEVVQRWEFIRSLISSLKSETWGNTAKLALFYDWVFFNPNFDNVMYIEPAMLLIEKSIIPTNRKTKPKPHISSNLVEYLGLIVKYFAKTLEAKIKWHIQQAMQTLISRHVIGSLNSLYKLMSHDNHMKLIFEDLFLPFLESINATSNTDIPSVIPLTNQSTNDVEPDLKKQILEIQTELSKSDSSNIQTKLHQFLDQYARSSIESSDEEFILGVIIDCLESPLFYLDNKMMSALILQSSLLCQSIEEASQYRIVSLLHKVSEVEGGFELDMFESIIKNLEESNLKVSTPLKILEIFCKQSNTAFTVDKYIKGLLDKDLTKFNNYLPTIYKHLGDLMVGKISIIELITSFMDPKTLSKLQSQILSGDFRIFGPDIGPFCLSSIEWPVFQQFSAWVLLEAELGVCNAERERAVLMILASPLSSSETILFQVNSLLLHTPLTTPILHSILSSPAEQSELTVDRLKHISKRHSINFLLDIVLNILQSYQSVSQSASDTDTKILESMFDEKLDADTNAKRDLSKDVAEKSRRSDINFSLILEHLSLWKLIGSTTSDTEIKTSCGFFATPSFKNSISNIKIAANDPKALSKHFLLE